jgi:hypothetical protein
MSELNIGFNLDSVENEGTGAGVRKRERIKDGISSYRILPPFGTNNGGALSHKYFVHWGFIGSNGKERSVSCSYLTEGYCPVCQRVFEAQKELDRAKQSGNSELEKELNDYISKFRVKKFWLYNAVTADGRVVMLELGKTAHDALSKKISEAVRRKVGAFDPTAVKGGAWFEFTRTGKGLNTEYAVDFKKVSVTLDDGSIADKMDRSDLQAELVQQLSDGLAGKAQGVLHDIHTAHEPMTSGELRTLMSGGTVPNKRQQSLGAPMSAPSDAAAAPAAASGSQAPKSPAAGP